MKFAAQIYSILLILRSDFLHQLYSNLGIPMQHLELTEHFTSSAADVWAVVGVLDRVDWVPGIQAAEMRGDERHMTMDGVQSLVEKIYRVDENAMEIDYGVIKSAVGITHHRAHIKLEPTATGCTLHWTLAIEPDGFKKVVGGMMQTSANGIRRVLGETEQGDH